MKKNGNRTQNGKRGPGGVLGALRHYAFPKVYAQMLLTGVCLTLVIELLSRKSLWKVGRFVLRSPVAFLCNVLIIFVTLSFSRLFPRRQKFVEALLATMWIVFGVVNAVVLRYRMTPFTAEDFHMVTSLFRIAKNYLTTGMIVMVAALLAALAVLIFLFWRFIPKENRKKSWKRWLITIVRIIVMCLLLRLVLNVALHTDALSRNFMNLADAYEKYGFAYCFSNSVVDVGIGRPDQYSRKAVQRIADGIKAWEATGKENDTLTITEETRVKPNIIMVQLESFFDPYYIKGYSYSQDPIPNFRRLKEEFSSGFLTVPVVGAGTANTEFEVLTGMSTEFFGAGEYPYNTVLQDRTVESVPNVLRGQGYTSSVLHNNTGTFYHRDTVFSQMGFDQFVPAEFMYDLETTPNNWVKDKVLTGVIMDCIRTSPKRDFVYTITVQSHGRYPEDVVWENPVITVDCGEERVNPNSITYYVNEIHEVDQMIRDLTEELSAYDEPVILVMYGDHLPALGFTGEDLTQPSVYQTEYVIWNNFGLEVEDQDIEAESLSSAILAAFGLTRGIIPRFHQAYDNTKVYQRYLQMLEYDMLYGEGYIFREFADDLEKEPEELEAEDGEPVQGYEPTQLEMGYKTIALDSWEIRDGVFYVYGRNFTESSRIVLDEKPKDTIFVDERTLQLDGDPPENFSELYVGQFDENLVQLGEGTNVLTGDIEASS